MREGRLGRPPCVWAGAGATARLTVTLIATHDFAAPGAVDLQCRYRAPRSLRRIYASAIEVTAIKVGSLTVQ